MSKSLSVQDFKAAIFDMDGTMVDNMMFHKAAWRKFLDIHNIELSDEQFRHKISGKKNDEIFEILFGRKLNEDQLTRYANEKEALYREIYKVHIEEVSGLTKFVNYLHSKGIKTAIATTAPRANRDFVISELGLEGKFDVILGDEHVSKGKPHPEIYLAAAERLGLSPSQCIVFEDTPPGVESGKRAGMVVVGILTSHSEKDLGEADYCFASFDDMPK